MHSRAAAASANKLQTGLFGLYGQIATVNTAGAAATGIATATATAADIELETTRPIQSPTDIKKIYSSLNNISYFSSYYKTFVYET